MIMKVQRLLLLLATLAIANAVVDIPGPLHRRRREGRAKCIATYSNNSVSYVYNNYNYPAHSETLPSDCVLDLEVHESSESDIIDFTICVGEGIHNV